MSLAQPAIDTTVRNYIPHHCVHKPEGASSKLRVVFEARGALFETNRKTSCTKIFEYHNSNTNQKVAKDVLFEILRSTHFQLRRVRFATMLILK
jgi:hypothetical protein